MYPRCAHVHLDVGGAHDLRVEPSPQATPRLQHGHCAILLSEVVGRTQTRDAGPDDQEGLIVALAGDRGRSEEQGQQRCL